MSCGRLLMYARAELAPSEPQGRSGEAALGWAAQHGPGALLAPLDCSMAIDKQEEQVAGAVGGAGWGRPHAAGDR